MINNKFELTIHAKNRLEEYFPNTNFKKEIKSVGYCTKDEVCRLKQTESYKKIKKGQKYKYNFYKTTNNLYLVCETKRQTKGVYFNVVVTIIDLKNKDLSLDSYLFKKEAIEAEYRLQKAEEEQENLRLNPPPKKKRKRKKKKISSKKEVVLSKPRTEEESLEKILNKLSLKEMFSVDLKLSDIEKSKSSLIILEMKKLNKSINKVTMVNKELMDFEDTGIEKHKNLAIQKIHVIDNFILKDSPTFKYYHKEGFKDYYIDFISFALKRKTDIIKLVYNDGDIFPIKTYEKFYNSFVFYNDNYEKTDSLQSSLDLLGFQLLKYYKNKMTDIYKNKDCYVIRWDIEKAVRHINYIKSNCPSLSENADKLIVFFEVVEEMFYKLEEEKFYIQDYL